MRAHARSLAVTRDYILMAIERIGFLGGGMMASSLMGGLLKNSAATAASIAVSEPYAPLREVCHNPTASCALQHFLTWTDAAVLLL